MQDETRGAIQNVCISPLPFATILFSRLDNQLPFPAAMISSAVLAETWIRPRLPVDYNREKWFVSFSRNESIQSIVQIHQNLPPFEQLWVKSNVCDLHVSVRMLPKRRLNHG